MKKIPDPILGTTRDEDSESIVTIDVDRLVETRLVLTAISGQGKSHALRRILEQTHGKIQHIVLDPEGEFYCVVPDTPVLLGNGLLINAGGLRAGDVVVSFDVKSGQYSNQKVLRTSRQAVNELWTVSASLGRTLTGTSNHRLLTRRSRFARGYSWKPLADIKVGEYIAIPDRVPCPISVPFTWSKPQHTIVSGDELRYKAPTQVSPFRSVITLPEFDDQRLFEFLGYFLSDGHLTKDLKAAHFVDGKRNNRARFAYLARCLFNVNVDEKDHSRKFEAWIRNKTLGVFLASIGCQRGRKARLLKIPDIVMRAPASATAAFLRAFHSCDGSGKNISTSSLLAATQLAYLVERTGCHASIHKKIHKRAYIKNAVMYDVNPITKDPNHGKFSQTGTVVGVHWVRVKRNQCIRGKAEVVGCLVPPHHNLVMGTLPLVSHNTLREKFPYVLAGKGGDCPAEPRSAALLAQKLLELRVSCIVDLYELRPDERTLFVKLFIDSLLNAPKALRHPCLVVVDEAHVYAPEKGEGEAMSRNSVIALMAQGRKRLLCPILATQRLSKLDKNAISEAHNMMIGKSILDIDVARAMRYLGFQKQSEEKVRRMQRGHFWTFGPAFSDEVVDVMVGPTITATPKLGSRVKAPAPPSKDIQKILGKLADLPEEALKREQTEKDLRAEIAELKKSLRNAPKMVSVSQPVSVTRIVEKPIISAKQMKSIDKFVKQLGEISDILDRRGDRLVDAGHSVRESMLSVRDAISSPVQAPKLPGGPLGRRFVDIKDIAEARKTNIQIQTAAAEKEKAALMNGNKLGICARRILGVLAQYPDDGCVSGKLTLLAGYRYTGSFKNSLSELRTAGLITGENTSVMRITPEGIASAGQVEPLPVGKELVDYWLNHPSFGVCERAILKTLIEHGTAPNGEQLAEATGIYKYTGSFKNALSSLRTAGVIVGTSNMAPISLNDNLFQ